MKKPPCSQYVVWPGGALEPVACQVSCRSHEHGRYCHAIRNARAEGWEVVEGESRRCENQGQGQTDSQESNQRLCAVGLWVGRGRRRYHCGSTAVIVAPHLSLGTSPSARPKLTKACTWSPSPSPPPLVLPPPLQTMQLEIQLSGPDSYEVGVAVLSKSVEPFVDLGKFLPIHGQMLGLFGLTSRICLAMSGFLICLCVSPFLFHLTCLHIASCRCTP